MSAMDSLNTLYNGVYDVYNSGRLAVLKESKYMNADINGSNISVNDVSAIEHNLDVKLSSKNLIPYPYTQSSKTHNEITFTVNSDGSLTANGTATGQAYIFINQGLELEAGTYTLSGCPSGGGWSSYSLSVVIAGVGYDDFGSGKTFTLTEKAVVNYINVNVFGGAKVENLTFYPQLEKGTTATAWASYITDVSGIEVSRYGKNLNEPQTATANADGTVNGLTSLSPNMILVTDTEGVNINCKYYRDIDAYINNLMTDVALTGGVAE